MNPDQKKYPDISEVNLDAWCAKLDCSKDQILFCIERVGTSWISVEAFYSMNEDRIKKSIPLK